MLSMTQTDAPRISLATPEDVKAVTAQALNIWTGALSPLWLPFWAATTVGVGIWTFGQALKRTLGGLTVETDTALLTKWPGFALPLQAAKAIEETAAPAVAEAVAVAEEAPKAAVKTAKKATEAVAEAIAPVEAVEPVAAETVEKVADAVTETAAESVEATADIAETATSETAATLDAVIDPATEAPVVPEVAEEAAETDLFKPLSAKVAPKHGRKR